MFVVCVHVHRYLCQFAWSITHPSVEEKLPRYPKECGAEMSVCYCVNVQAFILTFNDLSVSWLCLY